MLRIKNKKTIIIIIIIIPGTMFTVLSIMPQAISRVRSSDECRSAPGGCRPSNQANRVPAST